MPRSRGRSSPAKPPPFLLLVLITLQQYQECKYLSSRLPYELQDPALHERAISDLAILPITDLCAVVLRQETTERLPRPCKPRFCSRENSMTVRKLVLAGFSESGLEVAVGGRGPTLRVRIRVRPAYLVYSLGGGA